MSCYIPILSNQGSLKDDLNVIFNSISMWSRSCNKEDMLYPLIYTLRYKLIPKLEAQTYMINLQEEKINNQQEEIDLLKEELREIKKLLGNNN